MYPTFEEFVDKYSCGKNIDDMTADEKQFYSEEYSSYCRDLYESQACATYRECMKDCYGNPLD